ncbi:uncharacterized protein BXZ73DRAFT_86987 [Epithele typhae]|uniref:uncharacterized protein n=1 Tax=Epithele typhae TaxID=378194 RepID=UPI00200899EB|nr:uncharacterized protein BXZ73DRAFT_86987 [Epithele typhae]KAH9944008.1 hypothetical protein BXZ73DRAFT_86987 [Epithele typhae]
MPAVDGGMGAGVGADAARPLNVSDALGYLDAVKAQFQDKPDVYNHFLDIMKDFKSQAIDTPGVIERVSMLFHGNPLLIQGFNTFLPPGYRIELNNEHSDTITVTTPMGQTTQRTTMYGIPQPLSREPMGTPGMPPPPHHYPGQPPFGLPAPVLPVGIGSGSRPVTPSAVLPHPHAHAHAPTHLAHEMHQHQQHQHQQQQGMRPPPPHSQSPALPGGGREDAALLGSLNARQADKPQNGEFHHAINYLSKIKTRYHDDPETYKQFLEILQTYQKESRSMPDQSQVYAQVQMLFKDAPDLMDEFKDFLPEAVPPSHPAGLVGILPQPMAGPGVPGPFAHPEPSASDKGSKPQSRRRKRPEKEPVPPPKAAGGRAAKRVKTTNQRTEPPSPQFSPYKVPDSPQPVNLHAHVVSVPVPQNLPPIPNGQLHNGTINHVIIGGQDELLFFDNAKKALENIGGYDDFLRLLNLFSRDVIDTKTLVDRAEMMLGEGDLMRQFKELLQYDDPAADEEGPPGSLRTAAPDYYSVRPPDDGLGPSYRRLPDIEVKLACSGRDRLCWSVLNDEWVSHPTWASEEAGFMTHKKNTFEDQLHKSEEERHEFQVQLEALQRTIAHLDPIEARIEGMTSEERAAFRLRSNLGGPSPAIYERVIKKIYGNDAYSEVLKTLQESPAVAVPVVVSRLRKTNDEWRRHHRVANQSWRETDGKNFYKALDQQGISFKANDKKCITAKHFYLEIESAKAAQLKPRDSNDNGEGHAGSSRDPSGSPPINHSMRPLGYQLHYQIEDVSVLHDAHYGPAERRAIEKFLRTFVPTLFMLSPTEFNSACGPLAPGHDDDHSEEQSAAGDEDNSRQAPKDKRQEGVSAQDLRTRLLKTAEEHARGGREGGSSMVTSTTPTAVSDSPKDVLAGAAEAREDEQAATETRTNAEDVWVRELVVGGELSAGDSLLGRRPFFAGTTFYTLLRLVQLLYSRLLVCKEEGARSAASKHASLAPNPVAHSLGLDEANGPAVVLEQAIKTFGASRDGEEVNVLYLYMLDAWEKVFETELDQATFEEQMRWFFRTKAYNVFTLDRVIGAIVKQVQTVLGDNKCQELWYLLQQARSADRLTMHDLIRYRRKAERNVGTDEKLYRFDWDARTKTLRIQLTGAEDVTVDENESADGRWRAYVAAYVMEHPSEWLTGWTEPGWMKRVVHGDEDGAVREQRGLAVRVQRGTYKLMYARGGEDVLVRTRDEGTQRVLAERAAATEGERRRLLGRLLVA